MTGEFRMMGAGAATALAGLAVLLALAVQPSALVSSSPPTLRRAVAPLGEVPLQFVQNRGQADPRVRYLAQSAGFSGYFGTDSARLVVGGGKRVALDLRFVGANRRARVTAEQRTPTRFNYLHGSDPNRWQRDLPGHRQVSYTSLWPGIDMHFRAGAEQLKYQLVVAPGADPRAIDLAYAGARSLTVASTGNLMIGTSRGTLSDARPIAYQLINGRPIRVPSHFVLRGGTRYGFAVGSYDRSKRLVIDPGIAYSSFLGGSASDEGTSIAVNSSGNAYVAGDSASTDFTMTAGAYDTSQNGSYDVFVAKLNAAGSGLSYATFIGGSGIDLGYGIAIDSAGNAYVTGSTQSSDFPTTLSAFDTTQNGSDDAFVTKLNAAGDGLVYSTFVGGSGSDTAEGIALDSSNDAYITGAAQTAFPTTVGAFDTGYDGGSDGFVTKVDSSGSGLGYSTYLGGASEDYGSAIAVQGTSAYVTGLTFSTAFPTTAGAYDTTIDAQSDAFATKLDATGASLSYSTFLGGPGLDIGHGIAVDAGGDAYVVGLADASGYPTTAGAVQTSFGGSNDAFVTRLNASGSGLGYSTYLGGAAFDGANAVAVDADSRAVVTGVAGDSGFPVTADRASDYHGAQDVFMTTLQADGSALAYSTFLGGGGNDSGRGIALDSSGNAYIAGNTDAGTFPTTAGAYDTSFGGGLDAFAAKLGVPASGGGPPDTVVTAGPSGPTSNPRPTFTFVSIPDGATFECSVDGAAFAACTSPLTVASLAPGAHTFAVRATDSNGTDPTPAIASFTVTGGSGGGTLARFAGPLQTAALGLTLFDARDSTGAARYQWDVNGDGRDDIACGDDKPMLTARMSSVIASTSQPTVRLTTYSPGGSRSTFSQSVSVTGISKAPSVAGSFKVPLRCASDQSLRQHNLTCQPSTANFGVVSVEGCLERVTSRDDVPLGEQPILDQAVRDFNSNRNRQWVRDMCDSKIGVALGFSGAAPCTRASGQFTLKEIDPLLKGTDLMIASTAIKVNGLTFEPQGGASIAVFPEIGRIVSSNAEVRIGGVKVPVGSGINLDVATPGPFNENLNPLKARNDRVNITTFTPSGAIANFAGLTETGELTLDLVDGGGVGPSRYFTEATLSLKLPSVFGDPPPSGRTAVRAYNDRGVVVDDIDLQIPSANLGGLRFQDLRFHYTDRGGDYYTLNGGDSCPGKFWKATANVILGPGDDSDAFNLRPPPPQNGISFCMGTFKSAGGELVFGAPRPEIFPGVELKRINFDVQLNPTLLRGGGAIDAADITEAAGNVLAVFATPQSPYVLTAGDFVNGLEPLARLPDDQRRLDSTTFALGGTFGFSLPVVGRVDFGNGYVMYEYRDFFALGGSVLIPVPGFRVDVGLHGAFSPSSSEFTFTGTGSACALGGITGFGCVSGSADVTSKGFVICANAADLFTPGVGYKWGSTLPEIWWGVPGDGCKPSGYWLDHPIAHATSRGGARAAAAATFTVKSGVRSERVRLIGSGGAPQVEVRGPDGEAVSTADGDFVHSAHIVALRHAATGVTWLGVLNGKPGTYTITPLAGSPAVASFATSEPRAKPRIKVAMQGRGVVRKLRYRISKQRAQRIRFFETSGSLLHKIGAVKGGKGVIRFKPSATGGARRAITARIEVGGFRLDEPTVAHIRVAQRRPGRVRALKVRRRRGTVLAKWRLVPAASRYAVIVQLSNGSQKVFRLAARRHSIRVTRIPRFEGGKVVVRALSVYGGAGPARSAGWGRIGKRPTRFRAFRELKRRR